MKSLHRVRQTQFIQTLDSRHTPGLLAGALVLCLLALLLGACDSGSSSNTTTHKKTVSMDNGSPVTYSTQAQDVVLRLFYGGGKVSTLEVTPEISIYGDGTFITGPGLQLRQGSISNDALQSLLHTLTSTDNLLQLHRQVFNDIPGQNAMLFQVALNSQNYQFLYGPFGNLQESTQDLHEYQQLGNAIGAVRNALSGPETAYTSQSMALLVYQTFRADYTGAQNQTVPIWPLNDIDLANAAIYECGAIPQDQTGPNADNGCLTYTVPKFAYLPSKGDLQQIKAALLGKQQGMFLEYNSHYIVILRPLLPDEIAQKQLAMYGSNIQDYAPVPLKEGEIPTPTPTA
ncbi:MAG TPA: hypothetical protein VF458_13690 [Ktedonobacteraceae bacterium]